MEDTLTMELTLRPVGVVRGRIQVVTGASSEVPEKAVAEYLSGELMTGANVCDH